MKCRVIQYFPFSIKMQDPQMDGLRILQQNRKEKERGEKKYIIMFL